MILSFLNRLVIDWRPLVMPRIVGLNRGGMKGIRWYNKWLW